MSDQLVKLADSKSRACRVGMMIDQMTLRFDADLLGSSAEGAEEWFSVHAGKGLQALAASPEFQRVDSLEQRRVKAETAIAEAESQVEELRSRAAAAVVGDDEATGIIDAIAGLRRTIEATHLVVESIEPAIADARKMRDVLGMAEVEKLLAEMEPAALEAEEKALAAFLAGVERLYKPLGQARARRVLLVGRLNPARRDAVAAVKLINGENANS